MPLASRIEAATTDRNAKSVTRREPIDWSTKNSGAQKGIDNPVTKWHHPVMEHLMEEPRKRITARVSNNVRVTLEQAAELLGATVNQFVVQTAYQEAQRVIERESDIRLSQKVTIQVAN